MFLLPAFLSQEPADASEVPFTPRAHTSSYVRPQQGEGLTAAAAHSLPPEKARYAEDLARAGLLPPLDAHGRAGSASSEASSSSMC